MDQLSQPIVFPCGLRLGNRVALAPLTNLQSLEDGTLGEDELNWLVHRAEGGFGLVSTCAAYVSAEGKAWNGQLGVATEQHEPGLSRLATAIRSAGAPAIVQLHHGGIHATLAPGERLSSSQPSADREQEWSVKAADASDLERVIADYVAAAKRSEAAGFSGVEIHGANGYLFTQFLSPADNRRDDGYGGSLEGRARLLRETLRAVRAEVSPSFAVGVRISPVDLGQPRGLLLDDSVQVGQWLAADGADFIHLSLMDAAAPAPHEPDRGPVVKAFRDRLPNEVPVFAAGSIWTRNDGLRALEAGADVAVLGRSAIVHGDWPRVSMVEGWEPIRPLWPVRALEEACVGSAFVEYLLRFPGLVEGGAPPRE